MKWLACVLFAAFVVAPAMAQLRESTTVEVVEVPVYVTAHGAAVTTLTRDNFELYVNGQRQSIDYFDTIDFAGLTPEQSHDVRQRRLYMLVFDLLSSPNTLHRAQRAIVDFIDAAPENDTFAVATFGSGGLQILVPFSRDHLALRRAIRNLDISRMGDPLHIALTATERGDEQGHPDRFRDPRFDDLAAELQLEYRSLIDDEIYYLGDLATRLAGMEGYKHIVLLSSGFDSSIFTGITAAPKRGDIRSGPMRSLHDLDTPLFSSELSGPPNATLLGALRGMNQSFANAGVFLDAIDIGGLRAMQSVFDNEALYALTRDTGGQVVDRRNDLSLAIQNLTTLQRVVYVLGFHSHDTGKIENRIKVKLVNVPRGAHASYRPSYTSVANVPDNTDTLRLADIINNDIPQNGVTTNVAVEQAPHGATVELSLPGREVLAHATGDAVGAQAMIYVASGTSIVAYRIKKIVVDVPRATPSLAESPVRLRETFDLPPGKYTAKVLVRMDDGSLGFTRADFTVAE